MNVKEFMTTRIEKIDSNRTVYDAIEKMVDRRIRSLVVRFEKETDPFGVITARDIVYKVLSEGKNPMGIKVAEIASRPVTCVDVNTGFDEVAQIMKNSHFARIFVCQEGRIIGVVSLLDVMSASLILRARGSYVSG
jgi:CBS domain-containing protein